MMLRNKTLLIICLTLAGLIGVLYGFSRVVLLRSFAQAESSAARQNLERAYSAVSNDLASLDEIAADYSAWDASCRFIQGKYPEYPQAEFPPQTFERARLSLVVVLDGKQRVRMQRTYDLAEHRVVPAPASLGAHLGDSALLHQQDIHKGTLGILMLNEGSYLVS
jgi:adenylate cyclase